MFVWLDLETTGLHPATDKILAMGIIVTDNSFNEVNRYEWVVQCDADDPARERMEPIVRDMHTKNGLLARVDAEGWALAVVEREAVAFLDELLGPPSPRIKERPCLAGNSVAFDRAFIDAHMPTLAKRFNYRLLDVSTLKVLAMATVPGAAAWDGSRGLPVHTPLADLDSSIAELAHWRDVLRERRCACGMVLPHTYACVATLDPEAV